RSAAECGRTVKITRLVENEIANVGISPITTSGERVKQVFEPRCKWGRRACRRRFQVENCAASCGRIEGARTLTSTCGRAIERAVGTDSHRRHWELAVAAPVEAVKWSEDPGAVLGCKLKGRTAT